MFILQRYVLWLFLKVLLVTFVSLTGLYIVIDAFSNLDEFLGYGKTHGGLLAVLAEYYGPRVVTFFDRTSGLLSLTAAMFAVTWLQRTNEMTAILAAGVSYSRILRPIMIAAVLVSLLAAASRELIIPHFRDKLARNAQDWTGEQEQALSPRYDNQTDILLGGRHTLAAEQLIVQPRFTLPRELFSVMGRQISAQRAVYHSASERAPGGYLLQQVTAPTNLASLSSIHHGRRPVILMPRDHPWLERDQCFVVSNVSFEQLAAGRSWRQFSSLSELSAALANPSLEYGPDVRVTLHTRIVQPLLDMTLLFLGLPLVLGRENRNIFVAAGLCLAVVTVFFLITMACHAMGNNAYLLSPAQAAWGPLLIFGPLAVGISQPLWE